MTKHLFIAILAFLLSTSQAAPTYSLTVSAINGTATGNQTNALFANYSINSSPLNSNYAFASWSTTGDCTINAQTPNTTVELRGNCNATAIYSYIVLTTDCTWVGWDSIQACGQFNFNSTTITYITNITNITSITNITNVTQISNITPGHNNTIDVLIVLAIIIFILFIAAELACMRILGVFASLLLLMLGLMILTDGIVYKVGDITIGTDSAAKFGNYHNISGNITLNETSLTHLNQTTADMYAEMTVPYVKFNEFIGLVLLLLSLFGMLHYGLGVGKFLNQGK